ncbi:restriction endonuclease subunit S [Streptomyces pseudogriseolus]|uniref:restriction endonuclease subunit S n=1 Tax=Streptomyces pseudogriseolus TaxID=36817 RepID=UPI0034700C9C
MTFPTTKLKWVATTLAGGTPSVAEPSFWSDDDDEGLPWVSISDMSGRARVTTTGRRVTEAGVSAARLPVGAPGTLLLSMYASLGHTAFLTTQASWNQAILGIDVSSSHDVRFVKYALDALKPTLTEFARSNTQANLNAEQVGNLVLPDPPLSTQRRIADFLDTETARIDRVGKAREAQVALLSILLDQLVDGATAGDAETLKKLGAHSNSADWGIGKVSRLCQVIPGYAFPSEGFLRNGGTRLLRGINVSAGETSWEESVSWDEDTMPTPQRFHLRNGDLVIGMDRPWISSGMRMTFISNRDLPALLLQRVACLRPKSAEVDMNYVYWSLRSSSFRQAVEGELTGVSVPHLSGDQIGGFTFPLPPLSTQRDISDRLSTYSARIRRLRSTMNRQAELLNERRQALITAAVTGQFDVSTASGRNVTEGVSA